MSNNQVGKFSVSKGYRGQPRSDNRTFALAQRAIDNGWNPAGRNKLLDYKFYWFMDAQYIELTVEGMGEPVILKRTVHDFIFDKKFVKALGGKKHYRKLITGAVLSRSPVDFMYREVMDKKARIGKRL